MTLGLALDTTALLVSLAAPTTAESHVVQKHSWYKDYYPQPDAYCFHGCYSTVALINYNYTPVSPNPEDYYLNYCSNVLRSKSILHCAQKYCTPAETLAGRNRLAQECEKEAGVQFPTIEEASLSQSALDAILLLNSSAGLATAEQPLGAGISAIPDGDWQALGVKTVDAFYTTWNMGFDCTFLLTGFWALVIAIGAVHRVLTSKQKPSSAPSPSWWLWIRRTLILPATFGKKQAEAVAHSYTIPPRLESILLAVYMIINVMMCFPGYNLFIGNLWYPERKVQLARYIADRTGFLSVAQLPMIWVFAVRNDPLMWVTGWSFATFNRFHRWIARISVLHAVVHSIAYSICTYYTKTYKASWAAEYWYCGGIATVVLCLLLGASAYYFREKCYDLFLMVHILMSVVFFVALWYHVRIFDGEFNYYLYPCITIWALDRLVRVVRTVSISVLPRFTAGVKATATYHRTAEMIRLDVTEFLSHQKIVPGLYYYLYMPAGLRGYESHPFTLCSWHRPGTSLPDSPTACLDDKELEPLFRSSSDEDSSSRDAPAGRIAHTLLIRPQKGMTRRLASKLLSSPSSPQSKAKRITIFLEGPYGSPLDLSRYSNVLFICGGSGISAAVSHSNFLTSHHSSSSASSSSSSTRMHIAWILPRRHRDLPRDLCAHELASVVYRNSRATMTVYLTSSFSSSSSSSPTNIEDEAQDFLVPEPKDPADQRLPYEVDFHRPDIPSLIRDHRRRASESLAVVACGTPGLSDVCRAAVVKVLGEKQGRAVEVGFFGERWGW